MKITAAVSREKGAPFSLENLELEAPRADEVLVRIAGTGLCHTDIFFKENPLFLPQVLGHEGAGIVQAVGDGVTKVVPGDPVVLTFYSCGMCQNCQMGRPAYCMNSFAGSFSGKRTDGTFTLSKGDEKIHCNFVGQSSLATHALSEQRNVVKIPKQAPIELMGPFGCGIQTGAGAVFNSLKAAPGSSIAVFGLGTVGLSAVMAAKIAGCTPIIGVDIKKQRLELAGELGATHVLNAETHDASQQIHGITGGGADFALECAGSADVAAQAASAVHRIGKCGITGATPLGTQLSLDMNSILFGRSVFGIIEGDSIPDLFIPKLVSLYLSGRFPADRLMQTYPLDQINEAEYDTRNGTAIKAVLTP